LCYGSPTDEHCVQPKDVGIMVEMTNAIATGVKRSIQFFHLPVPKGRTDDPYYVPLETLKLGPETELYLGLIHHDAIITASRAAPRDVRPVNSVHPGPIDTDMIAFRTPEQREERIKQVPMHRYGTPEEVAQLVAFLLSDESSYITGAEIAIDGASSA
jgi:hypothetical protein